MRARCARLLSWSAAVALGAAPAAAGSQSSNSSSNCSNGRCARIETYETERGGFRQGWGRVETWDERGGGHPFRGERPWPGYDRRHDEFQRGAPRRPRPGADRDD